MQSWICALLVLGVAASVSGHGYLQKPAARNCMWRFGFNNPKNYGDNELFCGGAAVMAGLGGKCGVCGDKYGTKNQAHMDGGRYANNIITANYQPGQTVAIEVLLTTSHLGYFEFRINDFTSKRTAGDAIGKLQGTLLKVSTGGTKYPVTKAGRFLYKFSMKLPEGLTCQRCVLQWWYRGGNNWGCDSNGCGLGKGPQEHFVNCADVSIGGRPISRPPVTKKPVTKRPVTRPPVTRPPRTNRPGPVTRPPTGVCRAIGACTGNPGMDAWCRSNCALGNCPVSMCTCA